MFLDEGVDASTIIVRLQIIEIRRALGSGERRRAHRETPDELLVPARNERRAIRNPSRRRIRFAFGLSIGHDPREQAFRERFTLGALVTFLVTVADVPIFNIGAPFWGLVIGYAVSRLLERKDFAAAAA